MFPGVRYLAWRVAREGGDTPWARASSEQIQHTLLIEGVIDMKPPSRGREGDSRAWATRLMAAAVARRGSGSLSALPSASQIAHVGLPFANPMSEAAVNAAVAALPLPAEPVILDTGCGSGEMLLRALRLHRGARGLGIDLDADAIAEARRRAADLPAHFEVRDAATVDGTFDAVVNVAASHVHGGFPAAIDALRSLAPVALYGEGFWQRFPSTEFLACLGDATEDELCDLAGLRAAIRGAGFEILSERLASQADWAHYEQTLAANTERHGDPDSVAYPRRILAPVVAQSRTDGSLENPRDR